MWKINSQDIKKRFIEFHVEKKNHKEIPAVPLIADNDPTLLFVNSGMFPLVPYLLGESHPMGTRLVDYQRCFRSDDIDEVGDARHTTCFEMLGNWSLGDYFKDEQLHSWFEFMIDELGLDINNIYQTVYGWADNKAPKDTETIEILKKIYSKYGVEANVWVETTGKWEDGPGVEIDFTKDKIFAYTDKNWWQRWDSIWEVGGPDSETFYDTGKEHNTDFGPHCHTNCDCGRFIEIGNSVFIQYVLEKSGWTQLKNKNVDFWGGLERLAMVVEGKSNVFETFVFADYIRLLEEKSWVRYRDNPKPFEIITDHIRAIVLMIMDGGQPSNKDQWYFVRRLIRRVLVQLHKLGVDFSFIDSVTTKIIENMWEDYPLMKKKETNIREIIAKEQKAFAKTLTRGMRFWDKMVSKTGKISGDNAFTLQATYGFPFEIIQEMWEENNVEIDEKWYRAKVEEHKAISRQWADQKFKSWLADSSEQTTQYHTMTHILHQALKDVLWDHVAQKGSNITPARLRFDFSHGEKVSPEQKEEITAKINKIIQNWFEMKMVEMNYDDAVESGAIWLFKEKYDGIVKVYTLSDKEGNVLSKELCTWPHLEDSSSLEGLTFKIKKEQSSGAGVRRIKAVLK